MLTDETITRLKLEIQTDKSFNSVSRIVCEYLIDDLQLLRAERAEEKALWEMFNLKYDILENKFKAATSDTSKLYYEAHITIEPVFDYRRDVAGVIAESNKFKLADLLMKKRSEDTEKRSSKDTFMTGHSKSRLDIEKRTRDTIVQLQEHGFKVWRYKIEDTLLDSRTEDVFKLLGDNK